MVEHDLRSFQATEIRALEPRHEKPAADDERNGCGAEASLAAVQRLHDLHAAPLQVPGIADHLLLHIAGAFDEGILLAKIDFQWIERREIADDIADLRMNIQAPRHHVAQDKMPAVAPRAHDFGIRAEHGVGWRQSKMRGTRLESGPGRRSNEAFAPFQPGAATAVHIGAHRQRGRPRQRIQPLLPIPLRSLACCALRQRIQRQGRIAESEA